ncbi:MAG: hypothetical protein FJX52_17055, partial [Alphaproteobacteria bacterium]|nr:hypothetical protein [Alphaproteobacteria bacterium]
AVGGDTLLSDHRSWGARHEGLPRARPARRARSSRIRVGYVSPDLCRHSISYFAEPLLERHDRRAVEVFCYADVKQPDDMTERFEHHASGWRSVVGWDDEAVAEKIRMDEIDVLVDLAGHTGDNRLGVFAMRPAPVQIAWLGYPFSTGLTAIDAMIGDHLLMPPGSTALEQIWRLDRPWVCYRAPSYAPDVTPVPAIRRGYATFGCFSNLAKINPHVVDVWAEILRRVPSARLVINNRWFADATIGESWRARFRHHDIQDDRVDFVATAPHDATLAYYAQIDVALDTFPFNGLTVTSEALWAGVPVVTLATSDRFVGRMGAALLDAIGLNRLIATTRGQYVEAATSLALDTDVLQVLRAGLRTRMSGSPLADEHGLARAMERAYHDMVALWAP